MQTLKERDDIWLSFLRFTLAGRSLLEGSEWQTVLLGKLTFNRVMGDLNFDFPMCVICLLQLDELYRIEIPIGVDNCQTQDTTRILDHVATTHFRFHTNIIYTVVMITFVTVLLKSTCTLNFEPQQSVVLPAIRLSINTSLTAFAEVFLIRHASFWAVVVLLHWDARPILDPVCDSVDI